MYLIILFLLFLIIIVAYHHYKQTSLTRNYLKTISGPPPVPIFGNTLDFRTSSSKFLSKILEYFDVYGDTIVLHARLFERLVITKDYKLTEYILSSNKILQKSDMYDFLKNWLNTGLLTSTGIKWRSRRKMLTPSFHFSILTQFLKTFESVGNNFIEKLNKEVGKSSVDIAPLVSLCTLDVICEAAMGVPVNALKYGDSEYVRSVKTMLIIVTDRVFSPLNRCLYFLTPNYFREKQALKVLHSYTENIIEKRMQDKLNGIGNFASDGVECKKLAFLDLLLNSTIDGKSLTKSELREEVDTFMFEGHDTTSSAVTFALYSLATHPDVQQKVVDEQKRIFGEEYLNPQVTVSDLQEMKYLELVIKETLRLYPSVPFIGRELLEDIEWEGNILPKGLTVGVHIFAIHRSSKYFSDPEKFIPERFENFQTDKPFSYIPFSAGPRNCIGQKFAMLEMKSIISKVIRNFELHPVVPAHVLELAPETILVSKNGVPLTLKRRKYI